VVLDEQYQRLGSFGMCRAPPYLGDILVDAFPGGLRHKADAKVLLTTSVVEIKTSGVVILMRKEIYSLKVIQNTGHWSLPSHGLRDKAA